MNTDQVLYFRVSPSFDAEQASRSRFVAFQTVLQSKIPSSPFSFERRTTPISDHRNRCFPTAYLDQGFLIQASAMNVRLGACVEKSGCRKDASATSNSVYTTVLSLSAAAIFFRSESRNFS